MLLQEFLGGGTGALVAAKRITLALLQTDPRQALKAVVLEERVEQGDGALHGPTVGSAVNNDVPAEGGAVAEIQLVVVRVPQQDPGFQKLQDPERGELPDLAIARVRRQHGQPVKRTQKLGPRGLRVVGDILH